MTKYLQCQLYVWVCLPWIFSYCTLLQILTYEPSHHKQNEIIALTSFVNKIFFPLLHFFVGYRFLVNYSITHPHIPAATLSFSFQNTRIHHLLSMLPFILKKQSRNRYLSTAPGSHPCLKHWGILFLVYFVIFINIEFNMALEKLLNLTRNS